MFGNIDTRLKELQVEAELVGRTLCLIEVRLREISEGVVDTKRLSEVEGAIEAVRGEIAAVKVYADAKHAAARASEDRERNHAKRAELSLELTQRSQGGEEVDSFEEIGRAYAGVVPEGDVAESQGVFDVPASVGPRNESGATARSRKRR